MHTRCARFPTARSSVLGIRPSASIRLRCQVPGNPNLDHFYPASCILYPASVQGTTLLPCYRPIALLLRVSRFIILSGLTQLGMEVEAYPSAGDSSAAPAEAGSLSLGLWLRTPNEEPEESAGKGVSPNYRPIGRRVGRADEGGGLESRCSGNGTVGSNPTPSAK